MNPAAPNPLTGASFFVDPTERSYKDMMIYKSRGQAAKAGAMVNLALQPKARWMGRFTRPRLQRKVRNYLNCVQVFQPGATPLIVVMRHQGIECNPKYDGGGVAEDNRTKKWYRDFAEAIGNGRVVLAFEPDCIGTINCLKKSRRKSRMDLFRYGVDVLSKLPNATIYLEGTASDWKPRRLDRPDAALHGRQQGARLHAQRDPPRLDVQERRATAAGSRAWWAASRS